MHIHFFLSIIFIYSASLHAKPNWSKEARLPGEYFCELSHGHKICLSSGNRKNIYELDDDQLQKSLYKGSEHALNYPVTVTQMQLPKDTMEKIFNEDSRSPLRRFLFRIANKMSHFKSFNDIFKWLGLHDYPSTIEEVGPNQIASMGNLEEHPMGVSRFEHPNGAIGYSFSCAACHSSNLFGVKVLGLTNRFPKANEAFILGKKVLSKTTPELFKLLVGPSDEDYEIFKKTKFAMNYVEVKKPLALGLDTSLAQVGLSLALRGGDEYATRRPNLRSRRNRNIIERARRHPLNSVPADSKPAVWWNLKYKTKWLSDGSIISGNPVHTNFLWNEIGRGVDLKELESWLVHNQETVKELTSYVFNTEAPKYNDFFPGEIDISLAKSGQKIFLKNCRGCHGQYDKGWDLANADELNYQELIETSQVWYHRKTPVIDVKTDPHRSEGMNYFYKDLNRLKISQTIGTVVTPQKGYIPPPLVGIWARWPYFHNNSIPTLYDVITPDFKRPKKYIAVDAIDKEIDFDKVKNGYPASKQIRKQYRDNPVYFYNTEVKGLSNQGHTEMLIDEDGNELLSHQEKLELIEFLKTL